MPEKEQASAWTAVKDPETGRSFYANKFTRRTTWTSPFQLQTTDWVEHSDIVGRKFYVNKADHQSSREQPSDFNTSARRAPGIAPHRTAPYITAPRAAPTISPPQLTIALH